MDPLWALHGVYRSAFVENPDGRPLYYSGAANAIPSPGVQGALRHRLTPMRPMRGHRFPGPGGFTRFRGFRKPGEVRPGGFSAGRWGRAGSTPGATKRCARFTAFRRVNIWTQTTGKSRPLIPRPDRFRRGLPRIAPWSPCHPYPAASFAKVTTTCRKRPGSDSSSTVPPKSSNASPRLAARGSTASDSHATMRLR